MSRNDIIRMAREAGVGRWDAQEVAIERFAAFVAAAEREACAMVCEQIKTHPPYNEPDDMERGWNVSCRVIANAIRARGQA
jgi:hypothetical protein